MNNRHFLIAFAALAMTVSTSVWADEIYRWTDSEGNIHYEDRPSGDPTEERLQFSYNRTNSTAVQKRVQTQRDATDARRDARADADAEKLAAADERASAEAKLAQCQSYRAKLKTMLESPRLYNMNDAGEREYLDDAARAATRTKTEELIKKTCAD